MGFSIFDEGQWTFLTLKEVERNFDAKSLKLQLIPRKLLTAEKLKINWKSANKSRATLLYWIGVNFIWDMQRFIPGTERRTAGRRAPDETLENIRVGSVKRFAKPCPPKSILATQMFPLAPGRYRLTTDLRTENPHKEKTMVAILEILGKNENPIATKEIFNNEFLTDKSYQSFYMTFNVPLEASYAFRILSLRKMRLWTLGFLLEPEDSKIRNSKFETNGDNSDSKQ